MLQLEMIDPQMGTWQYEYDPDGNLPAPHSKGQLITVNLPKSSKRR